MANGLTDKQRIWVDEYLKCWNATEAARLAGYENPRHSGYENSTKPYIQAEISKRLSASAMSAGEVLERLGNQGRFDPAELWVLGEEGVRPNWGAIRSGKYAGLIKSIKQTRDGWQIECYDGQRAIELIGKHHGLFTDKQEHSWDPAQFRAILEARLRANLGDRAAGERGPGDTGSDEVLE